MNRTLFKIGQSREDLSEYLYHFTNGSHALETLEKITASNSLLDVRSKGVICFTEAPLTLLVKMFDIFSLYPDPIYAPYGVAIKKSEIFKMGGRPVIYGDTHEKLLLDEAIRWRFEEYHPETKDFSWLREWRVKTKKIELNKENCFIVTKLKDELSLEFDHDEVGEIVIDGDISDNQTTSYAYMEIKRRFKGISLEEIKEYNSLDKEQIAKKLASQNFDDTQSRYLGSFQ